MSATAFLQRPPVGLANLSVSLGPVLALAPPRIPDRRRIGVVELDPPLEGVERRHPVFVGHGRNVGEVEGVQRLWLCREFDLRSVPRRDAIHEPRELSPLVVERRNGRDRWG